MAIRTVTANELLCRPPGQQRCELVRGEVQTLTPPGYWHAEVAQRLAEVIGQHVRTRRLGRYFGAEIGFWIARSPDTVRAPDGAFLRTDRVRELDRTTGFVDGAPDLAIEVLSPADRRRPSVDKCREWLAAGARMTVLIDPERRSATVFTASDTTELPPEGTLTFGDVIPDLAIPLAAIFA